MTSKSFVIDMEHHYIPPEAVQLIRKTDEHDYTYPIRRFAKSFGLIKDIGEHLRWMDDSGIAMAILSTGAFSANGHDFCRACNDGYSEVIKRYPDQFKGMIHVYPYGDQNENQDEIKRGFEELGLFGISLVSSYQDETIDSPIMDHVYQLAIKFDIPVFIHPTLRKNLWGGEKYDLFLTASREYDLAKSFVEIIYGVLPRYPELKVLMSHLGGGLPALKGRFLAKHQPDDFPLPPEERGQWLTVNQAKALGLVENFDSLLKNFCFDSAGYGGWVPIMKFALEVLGSDHVCFGTDYPFEFKNPNDIRKYITDIKDMGASGRDQEKFLGENLKKIFLIK
jgi:predicted TIM-barrel fold metal-dependent hydrolase